MLIPSSQQTTPAYYSGAESSSTATGVNQASARAAIPPVEASGKEAAAQNQLFNARTQDPVQSGEDRQNDSTTVKESDPDSLGQSAESEAQSEAKEQANKQLEQRQQLQDQELIDQLKARDREVRVHEAAHASVGGQYAGSPNFEYTRGPDGKNYATGGEVGISVSEANDPQSTIEKARVIQAAALAPAQPSAQDRQVAAQAARMELNAQAELQQEKAAEAKESRETADEPSDADESSSVETPQDDSYAENAIAYAQTGEAGDSDDRPPGTANAEMKAGSSQESNSLSNRSSASNSFIQQFHQQGPSDPQNPYGKSGQLNILA